MLILAGQSFSLEGYLLSVEVLCSDWLRRPGLQVFATARDESSLNNLKALGIEPVHLEITSHQQIQEARRYVEERTGGTLDILVNNAYV